MTQIEGQDVEVIGTEDFINGLTKLGLKDLQTIEYACLVKLLSLNDEETLLRINDLEQILKDYGITDENTENPKEKKKLNTEQLDEISIVLLFAFN